LIATSGSFLLHGCTSPPESHAGAPDHKNAEYVLAGQRIKLDDGVSEIEAAPGSASKIRTRYFGNEARHDLNADGKDDVVFVLTHETGGSGVFFYVVAALATEQGFVGSEGVLLGDRIAPQTTQIGTDRIVTVSYADRAPGEGFAVPPSQVKIIRLLLDTATLQFGEVAQDFEGEANPAAMTLGMKTWAWIGTRDVDGQETATSPLNVFTLTFAADGKFTATTDCNRVGGTYAAADGALTFSDFFATRMYCEGSQEQVFTRLLDDTTGYRFTSRGELILDRTPGNGAAVFR
jgi:heat shock protein HslJ